VKTLLGVSVNKIDTYKYVRQLRSVIKWIQSGARGTIVAATGFGKSFLGFLAIKKLDKLKPGATTIIIVPTIPLKEQWESQIIDLRLPNVSVYVVNTIALKDIHYKCDLLIVDEVHLMAAEQFSRIFHLVKYTWILGLTATLKRMDGKEVFIKSYAPVVDSISQKEAIENGWISDYIEINLQVPLMRAETEQLAALDKTVSYYMSKFGNFGAMQSCMSLDNAKTYARQHYPSAHQDTKSKEIQKWSILGNRSVQARKEFLYNTERKVDAAVELIKEFDLKTITFSQSTAFADTLRSKLGDIATAYHSNIESEYQEITKKKKYKTKKAADKFALSKKGKVSPLVDEFEVKWKELKKFGVKSLKDQSISKFKDNRSKVSVICTARALDQGFDVADTELGIDASRTSNPTQHQQRVGRTARNFTYKNGTKKRGVFINLYIPNSADERWLRNCQVDCEDRVIQMYSVSECVEFITKLLKS
tara:strand:- start:344 stop:1771 length:1428 start_codon:yes stop_codon:yes gene_type:complete